MRETGGGRTKIQKFLLTSRGVDSIIIFPFCPAAVREQGNSRRPRGHERRQKTLFLFLFAHLTHFGLAKNKSIKFLKEMKTGSARDFPANGMVAGVKQAGKQLLYEL